MSETNLRAALDKHLNTMPGALPISWENKGRDQDNEKYLTQFLLPAENISVGVQEGGTDILAGVYQVTVNVPKGEGKASYLTETEKVKARFPRSSKLEYGGTRIMIHKVWSNGALEDENFYRVPISIRYRAI